MPSLLFDRADAPPANVAQIVLPPGMTVEEFFDFESKSIQVSICVSVAFAIICWDYAVLLGDEIRLYRTGSKHHWRMPATWAFLVLRYSAFLATLPALFFSSIQTQHCQTAVILSQAGVLLVVASAGIIFCSRAVAIWGNDKLIIALLATLWTGMIGCWMAVAIHYHAITGPPTPLGSNCQMQPIVSWAPISYASSVVFDLAVLVLSVGKLRSLRHAQSAIARQIARDGVAYFVLAAVTNIAVLAIQAVHGNADFEFVKPTAVPFSTVVTVAMAQRVYLNLKLFHQRADAAARLPTPSLGVTTRRSDLGSGGVGGGGLYKSFSPAWETEEGKHSGTGTDGEMPLVYIRREVATVTRHTT